MEKLMALHVTTSSANDCKYGPAKILLLRDNKINIKRGENTTKIKGKLIRLLFEDDARSIMWAFTRAV